MNPNSSATTSPSITPDDPISKKDDDKLSRYPLAEGVARVIAKSNSSSLVVGIEGEWGSGKTSFINLIEVALKEQDNIEIIKFNPWIFSDQNELILDFFRALISTLDREDLNELREKMGGLCEKSLPCSSTLSLGTGIPGVGSVSISRKIPQKKLLKGNTLEKQRTDINDLFKKASENKRIIVVIDDIDRLDSNETKLIFKLVKIVANFPNTIFILAYDRESTGKRLSERLDGKTGFEGEEYLEKIVQLSFILPEPRQDDLSKILLTHVNKAFNNFSFDRVYESSIESIGMNEEKLRWYNLFNHFLVLFSTVRAVKRYTNSLHIDLEITGENNVNPVDFLGIETIRTFAPKVYLAMRRKKNMFFASKHPDHNPAKGTSKDFDKIITENSPEDFSEDFIGTIREIIKILFPQVEGLYSDGVEKLYAKTYQPKHDEWGKQQRICSYEYFDRYFSLSILPETTLEEGVDDLLKTLDDV